MKNNIFLMLALFSLSVFFNACSEDSLPLPEDSSIESRGGDDISFVQLPQNIKDYILSNYPNATVVRTKFESRKNRYEVYLDNGLKIKFTADGGLIKVETYKEEYIDASALPRVVRNYINANNRGAKIMYIKRRSSGSFEIYLDNGFEFEFDESGNLTRIEDFNLNDNLYIDMDKFPRGIKTYLSSNYPNDIVTKVKVKKYAGGYEVKLSSELKLEFTTDGSFIRIKTRR